MKISIVIPVYNEAERLGACLAAISAQRLPAHEVIVVDNNSSDGTAAIAGQFHFVKLITERRQGVVHARSRGFDAASGDIIARLDADTLLPADWTERLSTIFRDPAVSAVSGAPHYYDFALAGLADSLDHRLRARLARKLADNNFLWGANMALRRQAWQQVRGRLCQVGHLHEDFDLGLHLQASGHEVAYDQSLVAGVSSRRIDTGFLAYVRYTLKSPRTYALHGLSSRRHMYPVLLVCWLCYLPGRFIYRAYNPATGSLSLAQLLVTSNGRVDPTTHVA